MKIGNQTANLCLSLRLDGRFKDFQSVVELGTPDIRPDPDVADRILSRLAENPDMAARDSQPRSDPHSPESVYAALGFNEYRRVDINEARSITRQFDLVANLGATGHCLDQRSVFKNIHDLCRVGGIMIHGLQFQGFPNDSSVNYQPYFFRDLTAANEYELIGLYVGFDAARGDLSSYSDELMKFLAIPAGGGMALFAVLRRTSDRPFATPYDYHFRGNSKLGDEFDYQKAAQAPPHSPAALPTSELVRLLVKKVKRRVGNIF
jgi:hypothetical protein